MFQQYTYDMHVYIDIVQCSTFSFSSCNSALYAAAYATLMWIAQALSQNHLCMLVTHVARAACVFVYVYICIYEYNLLI
jgi:hypothetical protein